MSSAPQAVAVRASRLAVGHPFPASGRRASPRAWTTPGRSIRPRPGRVRHLAMTRHTDLRKAKRPASRGSDER